jgi:transposase-like protein
MYNKMSKRKKKDIGLVDIINNFQSEDDCIKCLENIRWKDGVYCPRCGSVSVKTHPTQKHQYYCKGCQKNFNVKIGAMFHKTKIPLRSWFITIVQMILIKKGVFIRSIASLIRVEPNTAWRITHKIREAMAKDIFMQKLSGTIEVDEAYIGGLSKWRKNRPDENGNFPVNKRGVGTQHQICIWGAVQRQEVDKDGNITKHKKARVVVHLSKNLHTNTLFRLIAQNVDIQKSNLMSNGLIGYRKMRSVMKHQYSEHKSGWYVNQDNWDVHTNNIESLWRCIKSNINGCRHRVSAKHLQKYINEQVFRFNYKGQGSNYAFEKILGLGMAV